MYGGTTGRALVALNIAWEERRKDVINKAKAIELFESNACLIKERDVILERTARKILGNTAVDFAMRMGKEYINGYGIGDYTTTYLPQRVFFLAITYLNVAEEREDVAKTISDKKYKRRSED